jgi:hypothetical protein
MNTWDFTTHYCALSFFEFAIYTARGALQFSRYVHQELQLRVIYLYAKSVELACL